MGVKSDSWIRERALAGMIEPFVDRQITGGISVGGVVSYGLSSYGYDMRVARTFRVFSPVHCQALDVKDFPLVAYREVEADAAVFCVACYAAALAASPLRVEGGE